MFHHNKFNIHKYMYNNMYSKDDQTGSVIYKKKVATPIESRFVWRGTSHAEGRASLTISNVDRRNPHLKSTRRKQITRHDLRRTLFVLPAPFFQCPGRHSHVVGQERAALRPLALIVARLVTLLVARVAGVDAGVLLGCPTRNQRRGRRVGR